MLKSEIGELTKIIWEIKMELEDHIIKHIRVIDEKYGFPLQIPDEMDKECGNYEKQQVFDVVNDIILEEILNYSDKYTLEDLNVGVRIITAWANAVGINISKKLSKVNKLLIDKQIENTLVLQVA